MTPKFKPGDDVFLLLIEDAWFSYQGKVRSVLWTQLTLPTRTAAYYILSDPTNHKAPECELRLTREEAEAEAECRRRNGEE